MTQRRDLFLLKEATAQVTLLMTPSDDCVANGQFRFELNCLLKKPQRLVGIFRHRDVSKRQSTQVQVVSVEAARPFAPRPFDLGLAKRRLDDPGDADRDLVLQLENILERTVE